MKHSIKFGLMGGMILFCLSMCLTSCEDILGEWSRPTPNPVTPGGGGGGSSTINATAIDLDQKMKVLVKGGDALTITVKFTPSDATDKTVTWESKDPTIATVENGVVTPVGLGITTITAKSGDLTATCEVFVGTEVDDVSARNPIQDYDILAGTQNTAITIPAGYHVAFNEVNANKGIVCSGDATIYLIDGKTNMVSAPDDYAGIKIGGNGTTLTIDAETEGTGKLNATGGSNGAGIGTDCNGSGGNIVINGGRVTATGGEHAAGIGTGKVNSGTKTFGTITINGGTVTATGGYYAAGIGTGFSAITGIPPSSATNTCGAIKINGGRVTATGGNYAAGIGTGYADHETNTCGNITIGTGVISVTATKGDDSPNSIGAGNADAYGTQTCGTITIGGVEYWDGSNYKNGGDDATTGLPHSPYIYPEP